MKCKLVSLFAGAGGLDLGFKQAGFQTIWANEFDKNIWDTFKINFPKTVLDCRSIVDVRSCDIPNSTGIIGGPPCQSWSEAGARRGIADERGQLFHDYVRILRDKKPLFFLAENVSGILAPRHRFAFEEILTEFSNLGYKVTYHLLNANHYGVPQDRKRVIIVGYRNDMRMSFHPPDSVLYKPVLKDVISDLPEPLPAQNGNMANSEESLPMPNHEYYLGGFSTIYMSRNRVRSWDEPSFTIQAGARHAPIHPKAPKMKLIERDKRIFIRGKEKLYRRLSVRECARIQTFPDDFTFKYDRVADGYKLIGNAVPVVFARLLALQIANDLARFFKEGIKMKQEQDRIAAE